MVISVVSLSQSHKLDRETELRPDQTLRENIENMSAPPSYEKSQAAYPGDGGGRGGGRILKPKCLFKI